MADDTDLVLHEGAADLVRQLLVEAHKQSAAEPIEGPDSGGVFPSPPIDRLPGFDHGPLAVVPDTNLLRGDIGRVAQKGGRTVLVNAANAGAIRLFCPAHVVAEVHEHAETFSEQMRISVADYYRVWNRDYLPLMRVIDGVPEGMLTAEEEQRVAELMVRDPDDVPAVQLVLALGGFFLSNDRPALRAVYGPDLDFSRHQTWVDALKAGGDAHELGKVLRLGALLVQLVGTESAAVGRKMTESPLATLVAAGAGLALFVRLSPAKRKELRPRLGRAGRAVLTVFERYQNAINEMQALSAPNPGQVLALSVSQRGQLARACLVASAHAPASTYAAAELSRLLPFTLAVPHGETKVRELLRSERCFVEVSRGRFQLGRADGWPLADPGIVSADRIHSDTMPS